MLATLPLRLKTHLQSIYASRGLSPTHRLIEVAGGPLQTCASATGLNAFAIGALLIRLTLLDASLPPNDNEQNPTLIASQISCIGDQRFH